MARRRPLVVAVALALSVAVVPLTGPSAAVAAPGTVQAPAQDPAAARLRADVEALVAIGPRVAGSAAEARAADHVSARLTEALGRGRVSTEAVPLPNGLTSRNVWATVGDGPITVTLGAHLDTVAGSPGADDNASGVAALLEVARRLVVVPPRPDVTVELAFFGAEERLGGYPSTVHHLGSRRYVARQRAAGTLPHWMVSVDMVGYGAGLLSVHLRGAATDAADLLGNAAGLAGSPASRAERGRISDHDSFADVGVPAAFLWRPDNPGYHTPRDTVVLDDRLVSAARVADAFVYLASSPRHSGRGLVHQLYVDLLGRRPDPGGVDVWTGALRQGRGAGDVGAAFLEAPESRDVVGPVVRLYRGAFDRFADHGGLVAATGHLRRGGGLVELARAFVSGPEFRSRWGTPDDAAFVELLYRNALGRTPDPGGRQSALADLASGRRDRGQLLVDVAESAEHRTRSDATTRIAVAYAGLLRRAPDPSGLASWTGRPTAALVGGILGSPEYARRFP